MVNGGLSAHIDACGPRHAAEGQSYLALSLDSQQRDGKTLRQRIKARSQTRRTEMSVEASESSLTPSTGDQSAYVRVDGKFFRLNGKKFHVKGLTYGPFAPNEQNEMFASREQTAGDFAQIRE